MHPTDIEGLAGIARHVLVMLLQNFVKSHKVQVDILLQMEEFLRHRVHHGLDLAAIGRRRLVDVGGRFQRLLDDVDLLPQLVHLRQGELLNLGQLGIHLAKEGLVGDDVRRPARSDGGGGRHGDGPLFGVGVRNEGLGAELADDVIQRPVGEVVLLPELRGDVLLEMLLVLHLDEAEREGEDRIKGMNEE